MLLDLELPSLASRRNITPVVRKIIPEILAARARFGGQDVKSRRSKFPWLGLPENDHYGSREGGTNDRGEF